MPEQLHLVAEAAMPQQTLQAISTFAAALRSGKLTTTQIGQHAARAASRLVAGLACDLWICEEHTPRLHLIASQGHESDYLRSLFLPLNLRSIQGRAVLYQGAVFISDGVCLPADDQQRLSLTHTRGIAVIPLLVQRKALGVLCMRDTHTHTWTQQERVVLGLVADITALALHNILLVEREEALQQYEEQVIAAVSHELRTPLTSILGYLALFQRRLAQEVEGTRAQHYLEVVTQQAHLLSHIVDELLDVALIQNEHLLLHPEVVSPAALLDEVLVDIHKQYPNRVVQIELPQTQMQQGTWDAARVRQILRHLLKNAMMYSPAHSPVVVAMVYTLSDVRIVIRDQGNGIKPSYQERIFRRFWRGVDNSFRKNIYGLGVGLYVSQALAVAHGGALAVESSGVPGQGSVFTLTLPWQSPTLTALVKGALG